MTVTATRGTVLLVAVNRFIALAIEQELGEAATIQRVAWSDEQIDALCDRDDIAAIVVDVTFLKEQLTIQRLRSLFDCPVVAVKASDPGLRIVETDSSRFLPRGESLSGWLVSVAGHA